MVSADFLPSPTQVSKVLESDKALNLNETVKTELDAFADGTSTSLSNTAKLFLTLSYGALIDDGGFVIDGALLRNLDRLDLRAVFNAADDKPIIVVNRSVPRRLVLPPRFQLLSRSPSGFTIICNAHEFTEKRETIVEKMQALPKKSEGLTTEDNSPSDIII